MRANDPPSSSVITGTGEFQRKDIHVIATVVIHGEVIRSCGFARADGGVPEGAADLSRLLKGHAIGEALRLVSEQSGESDVADPLSREVLVEAFHRAVETCLDQQ